MTYPSLHIPVGYRRVNPPPALDHGPRGGPPRAFVWHHAEGNNVAAYLSRNPARGVSVNFTVEADGEIIWMIHPDRISGTVNPRTLRRDDDAPGSDGDGGRYGVTAARQLLTTGWSDPNRWCIGVELAGKAVDGPNAKQVESMARLTRDMRARYGPALKGNLAHRDFQDVKRCPGNKVPWSVLGGHGAFGAIAEAGDQMLVDLNPFRTAIVKVGTPLSERSGGPEVAKVTTASRRQVPGYSFDLDHAMVASDFGATPGKTRGYFVPKGALSDVKIETPAPGEDCTPEELTKERNTGFNEGRDAVLAAGNAVLARAIV